MTTLPRKLRLTLEQEEQRVEAIAAFMKYCPFFCYFYFDQLIEWPTDQIPTAATDAKRVFYNPFYFGTLKPLQRAFALAHETYHAIFKHPQRMKFYRDQGHLDGLPFDPELFNIALDYPINADLVDNNLGMIHPDWLYDPDIKADELGEDVYKKLFKKLPPPPPSGGGGQRPGDGGSGGQQQMPPPSTYGQHKGGGRQQDQTARAAGGRFDEVLVPATDPATGKDDVPSEMEFKEAIARAVDAAEKSQGKLPGSIRRLVKEILEPQVQWREHIRMLVTGKVGHRGETWARPNRRRLVLSSLGAGLPVYMPGRNRFGADLVVCVVDNSGSVSDLELAAFFGEMTGILADCRPKNVMVIWCDAAVREVAEARNLQELNLVRERGSAGGGGTSFIPPFEYLKKRRIEPDTLVYLTDMMGSFPAPSSFPTIWCATTDKVGPFGETVRVKV